MPSDRHPRLCLLVFVAASLSALHWPAVPAGATETMVLTPMADTSVAEADPESNFGDDDELASDRSPSLAAYLRFDVPPLSGTVRRATLRLYVTDATYKAPTAHATSTEWDELTLTWSSRPAAGAAVDEPGRLTSRRWAEYDVTSAVAGEGPLAFVLVPRSTDGADFTSGEGRSERRPQLVVETEPATTSTTSEATTSSTEATSSTTSMPEEETTTSTTATWTPEEETTTTSTTTTTTTIPDPPDPVSGTSCRPGWGAAEDVADLPAGLTEVSGLAASQAHPGWGWMIRDSDNPASLYSVRLDGGEVTVHEFPVPGAGNRDWEEVAYTTGADGRGVLWILENMGNDWNGNRRIYQVEEPDPSTGGSATLLGTYEFAYPDRQWNTEILFALDGDLVLIAKTSPRMYRFTGPLARGKVNVPEFVGVLPDVSAPTLGGLSPDRRFLVVANYSAVWVFENRGALSDLGSLVDGPPLQKQKPVRDDREGGTFFPAGSCDFVMTAESGNVWKLANGG